MVRALAMALDCDDITDIYTPQAAELLRWRRSHAPWRARPRPRLARQWREMLTRLRYVATTGLRRRVRDIVMRSRQHDRFVVREDVARRYLAGDGIEIGPLFWPLRLPPGARARTVDLQTREELVAAHAGGQVDVGAIPPVDIVDDAEQLATLADASVDFLVANHVLEHIEDPIAALEHWLRVLRPGGILFLTLPDAVTGFDSARRRTSVEHLLRDHSDGPAVSRQAHYEEWARLIEGAPEEHVATRAAAFAAEAARHHFHVWELAGFIEFVRATGLPCELEYAQRSVKEFIVVLRKPTGTPAGA